jgi:hypothetical protein
VLQDSYTKNEWIMASELAARLGRSRAAITLAIQSGRIPAADVERTGRTVLVHARRATAAMGRSRRPLPLGNPSGVIGEDSVTVRGCHSFQAAHRWTEESGRVARAHPYGPAARQLERTLAVITLLRTAEEVQAGRQ